MQQDTFDGPERPGRGGIMQWRPTGILTRDRPNTLLLRVAETLRYELECGKIRVQTRRVYGTASIATHGKETGVREFLEQVFGQHFARFLRVMLQTALGYR